MIPAGNMLPVFSLLDVPIERDTIGAMGWQGSIVPDRESALFKPYVYGASDPALRPIMGYEHDADVKRERYDRNSQTQASRFQKRRAEQVDRDEEAERQRRREVARMKRESARRLAIVQRENYLRDRTERLARELALVESTVPYPSGRWRKVVKRTPPPPQPSPIRRPPSPAPGWSPLTGDDIDSLLETIE